MKYCRHCLMPKTKPHMTFDEAGVCSACKAHEIKNSASAGVDWGVQEKKFAEIVLSAKARQAPYFDALVPVSGGKDSIAQVHHLLPFDLRILAVNVDYGIKTEIGRRNLRAIPDMGAHLMTFRPELELHKALIRLGFEEYGDPDLLSHTLLHAAPLHLALRFQIPLVVLGENSAFEYSGDEKLSALSSINRAWFSQYAANAGRDARYVSATHDIPYEKLVMYDFPDELETSQTRTVFTSSYFFWDSENHLEIARRYGFESLPEPREGTYRTYVGIDEKINRIHQYFKVLKFGYGRATDHACEDIRNGRITREKAKELVRRHDLEPISEEYINDFCAFIQISRERFDRTIEKFRNNAIWSKDAEGTWHIPNHLEE